MTRPPCATRAPAPRHDPRGRARASRPKKKCAPGSSSVTPATGDPSGVPPPPERLHGRCARPARCAGPRRPARARVWPLCRGRRPKASWRVWVLAWGPRAGAGRPRRGRCVTAVRRRRAARGARGVRGGCAGSRGCGRECRLSVWRSCGTSRARGGAAAPPRGALARELRAPRLLARPRPCHRRTWSLCRARGRAPRPARARARAPGRPPPQHAEGRAERPRASRGLGVGALRAPHPCARGGRERSPRHSATAGRGPPGGGGASARDPHAVDLRGAHHRVRHARLPPSSLPRRVPGPRASHGAPPGARDTRVRRLGSPTSGEPRRRGAALARV